MPLESDIRELRAYNAGRVAGEANSVHEGVARCHNEYELACWFEGLGDELTAQRITREAGQP